MTAIDYRLESDVGEQGLSFDPLVTPYIVDENDFPPDNSEGEQFRFLLHYAILAPSSHNTQPWKFQILPNGIAVFADYTRRLPVVDPNNRELIMGVGAAVFNLRVAALRFGFRVRVSYNHSGASDLPIAFVELARDLPVQEEGRPISGESDIRELFAAIRERHTNRHPFLAARVPKSIAEKFLALEKPSEATLFLSTDGEINMEVAHLVEQAERRQHNDPEFRKELARWIRLNLTRRPDGMPGAVFGMGTATSALASWATKTLDVSRVLSAKHMNLCLEAPALIVINSEDDVIGWLETGQLLQHLLLVATGHGLQCSFFNMPIEIPEFRIVLRRMLGLSQWPQLLLRAGYSLATPAVTPRRPVEETLISEEFTGPENHNWTELIVRSERVERRTF
jgi:nitroreductase